MQHRSVVRANDVGYGNNKFTLSHIQGQDGKDTPTGCFPSLVVQRPSSGPSYGRFFGGDDKDENVVIPFKDANYLVGPSTIDETNGTLGRNLNVNYAKTDDYLALVLGSLYYMAVPEIDLLVLGLPLNTFNTHKDLLRDRVIGAHTIPNPRRKMYPSAEKTITVTVRDVKVMPQPVGAFYSFTVPRKLFKTMLAQTNLVLDVGYGTFDWFLAYGVKPQNARCDAYPGGVSGVAEAIAEQIDQSLRLSPRVMQHIDDALNGRNETFFANGHHHRISDFKTVVESKIVQQINAMLGSVKSLSDVQNVLLTGGGAGLFLPYLKEAIGAGPTLLVDDNPIYSNVLGFQLYGQQCLNCLE